MTDRDTEVDILLTNCRAVSCLDDSSVYDAIAIRDADIIDIGDETELRSQIPLAQTIDCGGAIVHAGLIEPHLHLLSVPFLGVGLDALGTKGLTYSNVKEAIDADATRIFAQYAAMRLFQQGFTTVCEPGTALDLAALIEGLHVGGINALVSAPYCWDDIDTFARVEPGLVSDRLLHRAPADIDRCLVALEQALAIADTYDENVQGFVCLYGLGSASDKLIGTAKALARDRKVLFNLHQDYTLPLREGEIAQHGMSGVERLDRLGVLDRQTSLTHMVYSSKEDFSHIARSGSGVIWCPLNILQRGYFRDATHMHMAGLREGVPVSIAADTGLTFGLGSSETAARLLAAGQDTPLTSTETFALQTSQAANCLGIEKRAGQLRPGMRADIVVRKLHAPLSDAASSADVAGLATSLPVDKVICAGRVVVEDGYYVAGDAGEISQAVACHRMRVLENAIG